MVAQSDCRRCFDRQMLGYPMNPLKWAWGPHPLAQLMQQLNLSYQANADLGSDTTCNCGECKCCLDRLSSRSEAQPGSAANQAEQDEDDWDCDCPMCSGIYDDDFDDPPPRWSLERIAEAEEHFEEDERVERLRDKRTRKGAQLERRTARRRGKRSEK